MRPVCSLALNHNRVLDRGGEHASMQANVSICVSSSRAGQDLLRVEKNAIELLETARCA